MAGNRINGIVAFSANFEPQIGAPLDARTSVPSKADLYLTLTWTANDGGIYVYNGLTVTVYADSTPADNGMYILIDAPNYTLPASWLFVGSGGGGTTYQAGDGINIDTGTTPDTIEVDLGPGCGAHGPNLYFQANQLDFLGVHIQDEGLLVGTYPVINFIGVDVLSQSSADPCVVDVYIPPPTFASHWNTTDGTTTATANESNITRSTVRISSPTTPNADNPFNTNGWAGTNQQATINVVPSFGPAQTAGGLITGFSGTIAGDAKMVVTMYDADGTTPLASLDTSATNALYQNQTFSSGGIVIVVTNWQTDTTKWKANLVVTVNTSSVFTANTLDGGRYHVKCVMTTDTASDGAGVYTYTMNDVFLDTDLTTPIINGTVTIVESSTPANILTKYLSGVEYYVDGSQFEYDVNDIDDYNQNTQGRGASASWNFRATGTNYALPVLQLYAWAPSTGTFPGWDNYYDTDNIDYDYNAWAINNTPWRFRANSANVDGRVYDPWAANPAVSSANAAILIDTYNTTGNSTQMIEYFKDEQFRLTRGGSSYSVWSSTPTLGIAISNQTGASGPFDDGCVVGSNLVRADKFFRDTGSSGNSPGGGYGTLIPNLATGGIGGGSYDPTKTVIIQPDYSGYSNTCTYHRLLDAIINPAKVIASFELTFTGSFPGGDALTALTNNDLKIYIRKKATNTAGTNYGWSAVPHSLHGVNTFGTPVPYTDPPTSVDGNGSACRTGSSSGNLITGSFGSTNQCKDGFFVEIQYTDSSVRIDSITTKMIFADGTTEG